MDNRSKSKLGFFISLINKHLYKRGWNLVRLRPARQMHRSRFEYQLHFISPDINSLSKILDIGSGGDPFPYATVLAERYIQPSRHRFDEFQSHGKPVILCDIQDLPFRTESFDFIYCSHVLEHVDDPIAACNELMRVGKKGYIETPHFMSDALFSWAKGMHKWFVQSIANRLIFFEYDIRRSEGVRSSAWYDLIFSSIYHPLQDVFANNKDLFTVMFQWEERFSVHVYYCDGSFRSLN